MTQERPLLEVTDLSVRYGRTTALDHVELTAAEGEVVVVAGPLRAGKSTLLRAVAGLVPVAGGTVALDGAPLEHLGIPSRVALGVCFVPDRHGIFTGLTVAENLALMLPGHDTDVLLATFPELRGRDRQRAGSLSGGEQQMLALSRAFGRATRLVLVDEPFGALAPRAAAATVAAIAELARAHGKAVVLAVGDAAHAPDTPGTVVRLRGGRVEPSPDP